MLYITHPALRKGPLFYKTPPHFISCLQAWLWLLNRNPARPPRQKSRDSLIVLRFVVKTASYDWPTIVRESGRGWVRHVCAVSTTRVNRSRSGDRPS